MPSLPWPYFSLAACNDGRPALRRRPSQVRWIQFYLKTRPGWAESTYSVKPAISAVVWPFFPGSSTAVVLRPPIIRRLPAWGSTPGSFNPGQVKLSCCSVSASRVPSRAGFLDPGTKDSLYHHNRQGRFSKADCSATAAVVPRGSKLHEPNVKISEHLCNTSNHSVVQTSNVGNGPCVRDLLYYSNRKCTVTTLFMLFPPLFDYGTAVRCSSSLNPSRSLSKLNSCIGRSCCCVVGT